MANGDPFYNTTTGGTWNSVGGNGYGPPGNGYTYGPFTYPPPQKSAACPHCTPRCPHGYPIDNVPPSPWPLPWVVWTTTTNTTEVK